MKWRARSKVATLRKRLITKLKRSRFEVYDYNIEFKEPGEEARHGRIRIYSVRLKKNTLYHGAGPTPARPMQRRGWTTGRRPIKMPFLQGADWVEFNDLLNDFCDEQELCADIFSRAVVIRRGWFRRFNYSSVMVNGYACWQRFAPVEDFMSVVSKFGPFPVSSLASQGSNIVHRSPAGLYRNFYARWSVKLDTISDRQLLTSVIDQGGLKAGANRT